MMMPMTLSLSDGDVDGDGDPCFRNGFSNDAAPQCRIHGKIGNFGTFGHHFEHVGSNFGLTPGNFGMTPGNGGLHHQQSTQPFHPSLHLNNWTKNFPPQDEVRKKIK